MFTFTIFVTSHEMSRGLGTLESKKTCFSLYGGKFLKDGIRVRVRSVKS